MQSQRSQVRILLQKFSISPPPKKPDFTNFTHSFKYIVRCASVLAWHYVAGHLPVKLVIHIFKASAICCIMSIIMSIIEGHKLYASELSELNLLFKKYNCFLTWIVVFYPPICTNDCPLHGAETSGNVNWLLLESLFFILIFSCFTSLMNFLALFYFLSLISVYYCIKIFMLLRRRIFLLVLVNFRYSIIISSSKIMIWHCPFSIKYI